VGGVYVLLAGLALAAAGIAASSVAICLYNYEISR
jgi:hypothetical protein